MFSYPVVSCNPNVKSIKASSPSEKQNKSYISQKTNSVIVG